MSQKNVPTYLLLCLKYKLILIKIGRHVLEERLDKIMQKVPTSPKICANIILENMKSQIERPMQYLHVHFKYHWVVTNTTGSYCFKNRQTCSKLHLLYSTCSKCPPPAQTKISDVDELRWRTKTTERSESHCLLNVHLATWHQHLRAYIRAGGRHFEHKM